MASNKKGLSTLLCQTLDSLVPGTRLELVRGIASRDFKSLASTTSATQAVFILTFFDSLILSGFQEK